MDKGEARKELEPKVEIAIREGEMGDGGGEEIHWFLET